MSYIGVLKRACVLWHAVAMLNIGFLLVVATLLALFFFFSPDYPLLTFVTAGIWLGLFVALVALFGLYISAYSKIR